MNGFIYFSINVRPAGFWKKWKEKMNKINEQIYRLRTEYSQKELLESEVNKDPVRQFEKWMQDALNADVMEPHAMTLTTVNKDGKPSSRIVLLRDFGMDGFVFYTNYNSKKGRDIMDNPNVAMNFFWPQVERQVRLEGVLEKVEGKISDEYFKSRPRESKIGAWVSEQSQEINDRSFLEEKFISLSQKYPGEEIPRPSYWGGYVMKPTFMEFWQGRPGRMHDRISYLLKGSNWLIHRLSP